MTDKGVPEGYKQTEVGVIPEDWASETLGAIGSIQMCKRIFSNQTSSTGGIPFFKIGTFGKEPNAYISFKLYSEFKDLYSYPKTGDVLISASGTIGRTVIFDGSPAYFQDSNIVWLDLNREKIGNDYLYHYYQIIKWASPEGTTISRLYNDVIRSTNIAIPPTKAEQIAIATVLSDMDALITQLEKLIAKKRLIKQGAMQTLLNPFDKNGELKDGWKVKKLGEICPDIEKGQLITSNAIADVNIPVVAGGKQPAYFHDTPNRKGITITVSASGANARYIYYCIYCMLLKQNEIYKSQTGGAQPHIHPKDLQPLIIGMPADINQQENISIVLKNMDSEITALENKLAKIQKLKQGMM